MRFSIIIPVYNVKNYIRKCFESIIAQTYKDFETIVIDDGSTDGSEMICDEYQRQYPMLFKVIHTQNNGLMQARRCGIRNASGDIFVFVDSDDYVDSDLLMIVAEAFKKNETDMVIYGFYRFMDGSECDKEISKLPYADGTVIAAQEKEHFCKNFILNHVCTNMWQKAVKRSCVDIDADYTQWDAARCEDVIQSFALLEKAERIMFLAKPLYYYRKNDAAMTATEKPKNLGDYITCTNVTLHYIDKWLYGEGFKQQYIARQNVFYYNCIRNIYKCMKKGPNTKQSLCRTIKSLAEAQIIQDIIENSDRLLPLLPKRLRFRIRLFDDFLRNERWSAIYYLITLNIIVERK